LGKPRDKNNGVRGGANGRITLDLLTRNYAQLTQRVPLSHRHRGILLRLSVIIPTYNRAALLPHAVASVWQAGTGLEVIVVDNASTDNMPQVCEAATVSSALRQRSEQHNP
jgi:cellulose synthase/poly-beta-1,6-N-acetylglucosamine synthase-like glycosyltransferase